jgi:hypothetical protein
MEINFIITLHSCVLKFTVQAGLNNGLVPSKPKKLALIDRCKHINYKMLEQTATMQ